jgi:hypothetical protein
MWKIVLQKEPTFFKYIDAPSEDLCLFALSEDGDNLKWCFKNKKVPVNMKMVLTAISNYPGAILHVPISLRNEVMKEYACALDPSLLQLFHNLNPNFILELVNRIPSAIQYLKDADEELLKNLVFHVPDSFRYIDNPSTKLKEFYYDFHLEIPEPFTEEELIELEPIIEYNN